MVTAIWTILVVVMLTWTAGVWVATELAQWTAQGLASGAVAQMTEAQAAMSVVPTWVQAWVGPELVQALFGTVTWSAGALESALPWMGAAVGWLVPLLWVGWLLGALLMIAAAIAGHLLVRTLRRQALPRFA